jgi:hypothetical protein
MTRNPSDVSDSPTNGARFGNPCLKLLVLLWPIMLIASFGSLRSADAPAAPRSIRSSVNPNVAPWWGLTVLPRIGEVTARRIVQYRESVTQGPSADGILPVFKRACDLEEVRGIGPKTVQRIARYLRFDDG